MTHGQMIRNAAEEFEWAPEDPEPEGIGWPIPAGVGSRYRDEVVLHPGDPNVWLGRLAAAVGLFLTGRSTRDDLQAVYSDYRDSPASDDELRAILPEPPK